MTQLSNSQDNASQGLYLDAKGICAKMRSANALVGLPVMPMAGTYKIQHTPLGGDCLCALHMDLVTLCWNLLEGVMFQPGAV